MTLIVGFKCKEGIALVSDTKVMDVESGESFYQSKILTPIENAPFIVGAAGYTTLFREFNRKIPEKVNESVNRIRIKNVKELIETGLTRDQAIEYLYAQEQRVTQSQQQDLDKTTSEQKKAVSVADIAVPFTYSAERFIDDCRNLIKEVSSNFPIDDREDPIDVLIGLKRIDYEHPELHAIDSKGRMEEIDDFTAIGSGSPYVRMFFDRVFDPNKNIAELITYAFRAITFCDYIAKENSVGYDEKHPPEAIVVLNDGRSGRMNFKNQDRIIKEIKNEMKDYEKLVMKNSITLEWDPS